MRKLFGFIENYFSIKKIILLAFTLRLIYAVFVFITATYPHGQDFFVNVPDKFSDSYDYYKCGYNFVHYGSLLSGEDSNLTPDIYKPPLYPILLVVAVFMKTFWGIIILQVILSCFTVWFIYRISLLFFKDKIPALIASFLYAVNLQAIVYSSYILTETVFTFLLTFSILFLIKYINSKSIKFLYIGMIAILIGIFFRPVGYYFYPLVLLGVMIFHFATKTVTKKIFLSVGILFAIYILSIGSWQYRNYRATEFSGFSSVSVDFLYSYIAPRVLAESEKRDVDEIRRTNGSFVYLENYLSIHPEQINWSQGKILDYRKKYAMNIIKSHIPALIKIQAVGMLRTMYNRIDIATARMITGNHKIDKGINYVLKASSLLNILLMFGFILSLFFFKFKNPIFLILIVTIGYFIAFSGFHGIERYRVPIVPVYLILSICSYYFLFCKYFKISKETGNL